MANRHRGDVDLTIQGETLTLRLTLGALAEIETSFGAPDLATLGERLSQGQLSASDLIRILGAAARGGGHTLSDRDFAASVSAADIPACVTALGALLTLTFGDAG